MTQIAAERGVHPKQLRQWKAEALKGLASLFEPEHETTRALQETPQRQLEELSAAIGRPRVRGGQLAQKKIWPPPCRELSAWH